MNSIKGKLVYVGIKQQNEIKRQLRKQPEQK